MRDAIDPFTHDELVQAARVHGLRSFTDAKLHRWRKMGLLCTPVLRSLGRGLGREALYSPETLTQLLMIDELLRGKRNFDVARWQLFLAGFAVPMSRLRRQFHAELTRLRDDADVARVAVETEDDEVAQRYLDNLSAHARKNARKPQYRILSKRIGGRAIPDFLDIAERLLAGAHNLMSAADVALLARAFGFEAPKKVPAIDSKWLSAAFSPTELARVFDASTDETLRMVRSEFLQLLAVARQLGDVLPELGPTVALFAHRDPWWPPPLAFLWWLRNRDDPRFQAAALELLEYLRKRFQVVPQ